MTTDKQRGHLDFVEFYPNATESHEETWNMVIWSYNNSHCTLRLYIGPWANILDCHRLCTVAHGPMS